jgi:hypothetical protein
MRVDVAAFFIADTGPEPAADSGAQKNIRDQPVAELVVACSDGSEATRVMDAIPERGAWTATELWEATERRPTSFVDSGDRPQDACAERGPRSEVCRSVSEQTGE